MTVLYNLHSDGDQWRITKFNDGNVESSYLCSHEECTCPAGHRHTCRHRQMLPAMLAAGLENSHYFWDFDRRMAFDISGNAKHLLDALAATKPAPTLVDEDEVEIIDPDAIMGNGLPHLAGVYAKDITPAVSEGLRVEGWSDDLIRPEEIGKPVRLLNCPPAEGNEQDTPQDTFGTGPAMAALSKLRADNAQRAIDLFDQAKADIAEVTGIDKLPQPHSTMVSAPDFDSGDGGSNPPAVAKPWRRL